MSWIIKIFHTTFKAIAPKKYIIWRFRRDIKALNKQISYYGFDKEEYTELGTCIIDTPLDTLDK